MNSGEYSVSIDYCRAADLPGVQRIEDDSFTHPFSQELFSDLLRAEPQGFRVAKSQMDLVVGYCVVTPSQSDERTLVIASIAVHKLWRRRGVGTALMEDVFSKAPGNFPGVENIQLQVALENFAAQALYERFGFERRGIVRNYYGPGEHAYVMSRKI